MAGMQLSTAVCANLKTEMKIRLASEWDYVNAKLAFAARQQRGKMKVCG